MSNTSDKKKALLAQKERLLQEISYYDKEIEDARSNGKNSYVDEDSSDSDTEFSIQINTGPTVMELKHKQLMLKTCLQATQELTSLEVLQSEVNIVVDEPTIVGEPPITEPGVWREVTAECCVDLVPFSITFYTHTPDRKFAPTCYRGLRVVPVKTAHEAELVKSVLPGLLRPSDAVEVLRSYAAAHRSRRTTLARLADKFAAALYMEPMAEGGYKLKCANLMEVSWTLQNKWSPIAPFHHRMKFDLEYMDESYIKTIQLAHRQLADPSMDTAERTQILAKIISTCLEAQGPTQELYESMSSDPETAKIEKRRTTLDKEPEMPVMVKNKKDYEVMAPPKSIPKKGKKGIKRSISNEGSGKRLKTDNSNVENKSESLNENKEVKKKNSEANIVANGKNSKSTNAEKVKAKKDVENVASAKINKTTGSENVNVKLQEDKDVANAKKDGPKIGKITSNTDKVKRKIDGDENGVAKAKISKTSANTEKVTKKNQVSTENDVASSKNTKTSSGTDKIDGDENGVAKAKISKTSANTEKVTKKNQVSTEQNIASFKNTKTSSATDKITNIVEDDNDKIANKCVAKVKNAYQNEIQKKKADKKTENTETLKENIVEVNKDVKIVKKSVNKGKNAAQNDIQMKKTEINSQTHKDKSTKTIVGNKIVTKTTESESERKMVATTKNTLKSKDSVTIKNKQTTNNMEKQSETKKQVNKIDNPTAEKVKKVASEKTVSKPTNNNVEKHSETKKQVNKIDNPTAEKVKKVASEKTNNLPNKVAKVSESGKNSQTKVVKKVVDAKDVPLEKQIKIKINPLKTMNKPKFSAGNIKKVSSIGITEKENKEENNLKTKIPLKKHPSISEGNLKKNPLRISPRKLYKKGKMSPKFLTNSKKTIQKPNTNIPRLMAKPKPKV